MSDVVFLDTETTGLALNDQIWEFAAIRRYVEEGTSEQIHFFIEHDRDKCAQLPSAFRDDHYNRYTDHTALSRRQAASRISSFLYGGPHIVGAVPNFDTERMARHLDEFAYRVPWHYHLIDVENLAVGFLAGRNKSVMPLPWESVMPLPWDSDMLSNAVGVDPEQFQRHTALGDALWAQAIYDKVMESQPARWERELEVPGT